MLDPRFVNVFMASLRVMPINDRRAACPACWYALPLPIPDNAACTRCGQPVHGADDGDLEVVDRG
jgi:hypothetical protein